MLLIFLALLIALFFGYRWWWQRHWLKGVAVTIDFTPVTCSRKETITLEQTVTNGKWTPLTFFEIDLPSGLPVEIVRTATHSSPVWTLRQVYSLKGQQTVIRKLQLKVTQRGVYPLSEVVLTGRDFLTQATATQRIPLEKSFIVYPEWLDLKELTAYWEQSLGETLTRFALFEDTMLFRGTRQMQPEDPYRQINWKKSAQTNTLYVNQYEPITKRQLTLVLYLPEEIKRGKDFLAETSIAIFITLARECLQQGWDLVLLSNAQAHNTPLFNGQQVHALGSILPISATIDLEQTSSSTDLFNTLKQMPKQPTIVCTSEIAPAAPYHAELAAYLEHEGLKWVNAVFRLQENPHRSLKVEEVLAR